ncbi:hypothetical protein F2Q70_00033797 [Brassica cretica]|uniref:Uncharacterized protein n=1 Tax=Brassica cretica TaxID=69181 RepID=A0A8S9JU65_BRACR|nr:hypothetical protein F2Q70_00033797 [Brassica cretica]
MSTMKPSRSDEIADPDQQIKNTNQIRAGFDSLAPKRPTKPTRSEPGPFGCFSTPEPTTDHPEADKFQTLQSQTHGDILHEGVSAAVQDEFLETEYYTSLTAIDKQHHTVLIFISLSLKLQMKKINFVVNVVYVNETRPEVGL